MAKSQALYISDNKNWYPYLVVNNVHVHVAAIVDFTWTDITSA